jgi:hypothetical protein
MYLKFDLYPPDALFVSSARLAARWRLCSLSIQADMELLLRPSLRWKGITMRKTLLAFAAAATLGVSAASPAYAGPRTYPGPGGYPYWWGYVDAPVGEPVGPCYWISQRFWAGSGWRVRRVRLCF